MCLGIDQTGAVDKNGTPRPLPSCLIRNNEVIFFYLESFSKDLILGKVRKKANDNISICVDCVIGLPSELDLSWREAIKRIRPDAGYGRLAATEFFSKLGKKKVWKRRVELLSGASSVFREQPFQRNIQTGSYRIWKDIAKSDRDFFVPFLDEKPIIGAIPIFEGYPSFSWKLLFNVNKRSPEKVIRFTKRLFPELSISSEQIKLLKRDKNFADAFVLALTLTQFKYVEIAEDFKNEGWILGFPKNKFTLKDNK